MTRHDDKADPLATLDPLGFAEAWQRTAAAALKNPEGMAQAWGRYVTGLAEASAAAAQRARGTEAVGPVQPGRRDRRFRDPAWEENPACSRCSRATCCRDAWSPTCSTPRRSTR